MTKETTTMEAPVYHVKLPSGMPNLLFPEGEYDLAFQHATGERVVDNPNPDEDDGEWRISIMDFEGEREVPIAQI